MPSARGGDRRGDGSSGVHAPPPSNPATLLERADAALGDVDGVLGRVDGTLGNVDATPAETRHALSEVKELLVELHAALGLVRQAPLIAQQVAAIHAAVVREG